MVFSNRIVRLLAAGALVLSAGVLTACAGEVPTDKVYNPAVGTMNRDSQVDVLNAMVVSGEKGKGTLITTLVNNATNEPAGGKDKADQLTAVEINGSPATLDKKYLIPAGGNLIVSKRGVGGIPVTGDFEAGGYVEVTFKFKNADPVTFQIPVVPNTGYQEGEDGSATGEAAE